MIRKLVKLAIFLLIANGVYRITPPTIHYYKFKDAVQELALFSQKTADAELIDHVMALADENQVPLDRDYVQVRRSNGQLDPYHCQNCSYWHLGHNRSPKSRRAKLRPWRYGTQLTWTTSY